MKIQVFLREEGCEKPVAKILGEAIPSAVRRIKDAIAGKGRIDELAGGVNQSGEQQLALDVRANDIVLDEARRTGLVAIAASEEMKGAVFVGPSGAPCAEVFDPLDGSSLVDVNFAVGSIFGIYPAGDIIGRTGDDQLAACYTVYGPRTVFVVTHGKGTHEFLMGPDGEFYLSQKDLRVAPEAKHFAPGNLRAASELHYYRELLAEWMMRKLTLRYSGGMVPDVHHIVRKGDGIFTYPGYPEAPRGKLRLLFECAPMAFLMEQAGGAASDGTGRILAQKITDLHQRTPIFLGSSEEVARVATMLSR